MVPVIFRTSLVVALVILPSPVISTRVSVARDVITALLPRMIPVPSPVAVNSTVPTLALRVRDTFDSATIFSITALLTKVEPLALVPKPINLVGVFRRISLMPRDWMFSIVPFSWVVIDVRLAALSTFSVFTLLWLSTMIVAAARAVRFSTVAAPRRTIFTPVFRG